MGKWASFTRPRLVPKAGQAMEGWVKGQQVRQTNKYVRKNKRHKQPTGMHRKAFFSREKASLADLEGCLVQYISTVSIVLIHCCQKG